jgi:hypothetical protein
MAISVPDWINKMKSLKFIKILLLSLILLGYINVTGNAQCTVTGVSGSGFLYADFCAPAYTSLYYEFTFGTVAPPQPSYRVLWIWGDGTPNHNQFYPVQSKLVGALTVYYIRAEQDHTFPAGGNCEYTVNMILVDNGFQCPDSRQVQIIANWHQDDVATASGVIALNPTPRHDVCEGYPLVDFSFTDASVFACNLQQYALAQKPNHTIRHQQYVYGTSPVAGRGIPNLFIKVGTAQTLVRLTDGSGVPVANSWTVNPITGGPVPAYSTASGYFEGPVVGIPVDAVTGAYTLPPTYPILFDGVGTVFQDQFQVTLRNWNICNPWNGSQTNPNSANANTATTLIYIIDAPDSPTVPSRVICFGDTRTLTVSSVPVGEFRWYSNAGLTTQVGTGSTYVPPGTAAGIYSYWVTDVAISGTGCASQPTLVTLTIRAQLPQPGLISGPTEVCINATNVVFSVPDDPIDVAPGGPTEYVWTLPAGWSFVGAQNGRQITVNIAGATGSRTLSVVRRHTTVPQCPGTARTLNVTVSPLTVGGSVTPNRTICQGSNSGLLTLGSHTGSVVRWQVSSNGGGAWTNIVHTGTTYTSGALNTPGTYWYRAEVRSGSCTSAYSNHAVIIVSPTSDGGNLSGGTSPICLGSSTGSMTVAGYTGSIVRWERRLGSSGVWTNINVTNASYSEVPISSGTWNYRVRIQTVNCPAAYSSTVSIIVDPTTVGGSVTGGSTICQGSTSALLTLAGHTGTVLRWQFSTNGGGVWNDIAHTGTTYTSPVLNSPGTYWYRAQVQSGVCLVQNSAHTIVTVSPTTVPGSVTGGSTVCQGSTSGLLTLSGHTGSVVRWQVSTNGGGAWSNITNTNTTYTSAALTAGTYWYRAQVQSGSCALENSAHTIVVVDPPTVAGAVGGGTTPICIGSPTGIMTLAGHTGSVVRWERRLGGAGPWTTIANITTTHNETPATVGSWEFRAIVRSGVCTELASTARTIVVSPAIGGWFRIGRVNPDMLRHSNRHNDPVGPYWLNSTLGETSRRRRMVNHIKYNNNTLRNTLCLRIMELPCNIAERRLSRSTIG